MTAESWDAHIRTGEEIGPDHFIFRQWWTPDEHVIGLPAGRTPPEGSVLIGLHEHHKNPDGEWCGGYTHFQNVPEAALANAKYKTQSRHALVSADPLHVQPSLQCRSCPKHGWIENGRWRDA